MRQINFPMNRYDVELAEKELGTSLVAHTELYNQVLDCNVCKLTERGPCHHCTEAMEKMRGAKYPSIDTEKLKKLRKLELSKARWGVQYFLNQK